MQAFDVYPANKEILKFISIIYLVYLAFRISTAPMPQLETENKPLPLTLVQAAISQ